MVFSNNTKTITRAESYKLLNPFVWGFAETESLEEKLLSSLKTKLITVGNGTKVSIQELVKNAISVVYEHRVCSETEARTALKQVEILITRNNFVFLSLQNHSLESIFVDGLEPYESKAFLLKRLKGVRLSRTPRKINGKSKRGLLIPLKYFFQD